MCPDVFYIFLERWCNILGSGVRKLKVGAINDDLFQDCIILLYPCFALQLPLAICGCWALEMYFFKRTKKNVNFHKRVQRNHPNCKIEWVLFNFFKSKFFLFFWKTLKNKSNEIATLRNNSDCPKKPTWVQYILMTSRVRYPSRLPASDWELLLAVMGGAWICPAARGT